MRALLALSLALSTLVAGCERPHANPSVAAAPTVSAVPAPITPLGAQTGASNQPGKLAGGPQRNAASGASLRPGELRRRSDAKLRDHARGDAELCPGLAGQDLDDCLALEERRLGGAPSRGDEQALRNFREEQAQRDRELFDQDANPWIGADANTDPQAQFPPPGYDLPPDYSDLPPDYNDPPPYYGDENDLPPDEQFLP